MKRFIPHAVLVIFTLAPLGAWAQQNDLDVTMQVVPADASGAAAMSEIKLPDAASDRARAASAFGQSTAAKAHEMKGEMGREFGQSVSESARLKNAGKSKGKAP
jgi:hypothetical protein